jgi:hypothetical protein
VKIAIGSQPFDGPWGGGNRFVGALCEALTLAGHAVVHDLSDGDIDLVLITDPRPRSPHVAFGAGAVLRYLLMRNPNAIVIHRVNECDERKGEPFINHKLVRANYVADATVFVGRWLASLPVWRSHLRAPWFVIHNGADARVFNAKGFSPWSGSGPLKLVTHHWGYHPMKGFDVYRALDRMQDTAEWRDRLSFTFVGNLPNGFRFENSHYVPPLDGDALAHELRSHHAYITASVNEPGGNHQNEGAMCGLPLLYRESGCMPEYCSGYGIAFSGSSDVEAALSLLIAGYPAYAAKMSSYPNTAERMTAEWMALFDEMIARRPELLAARRLWRDPLAALMTQAA